MSIEAMKQAMAKVRSAQRCHPLAMMTLICEAEDILQDAIEAAEKQEPLAAPVQERKPVCWEGEDKCPNRQACCDAQHCLYTTPPAGLRQWVGLTDDDWKELSLRFASDMPLAAVVDAIEAKLKEKNG